MELSRRDLRFFLPALAAAKVAAAGQALPSNTFRYEDLKVHGEGLNRERPIFQGETHTGVPIELHETELAPGQMPHAAHHHLHEEMVMVRQGTLEVTISGKSVNLGPGSVGYVASNEEHGWRNVGQGRATYWVFAIGRDKE
jgi:quercetin dioxygenase-like cupin family protein